LDSDEEDDDDVDVSYTLTASLIKKWVAIRNKYYPEGDTFAKKTVL